jgi:hypothetical protein
VCLVHDEQTPWDGLKKGGIFVAHFIRRDDNVKFTHIHVPFGFSFVDAGDTVPFVVTGFVPDGPHTSGTRNTKYKEMKHTKKKQQ